MAMKNCEQKRNKARFKPKHTNISQEAYQFQRSSDAHNVGWVDVQMDKGCISVSVNAMNIGQT
jgi:hypothetical protein